MKNKTYEAPLCEVMEVEVENGILAGSVASPGQGSTMGAFDNLIDNLTKMNN